MSNIIKSTRLQIVTPKPRKTDSALPKRTNDIQNAILQATKVIDQAKKEAEAIIAKAEAKADRLVQEARTAIEKEATAEKNKAKEKGWQEGYNEGISIGRQEVNEQVADSLTILQGIIEEATETRSRSLQLLEDDFLKLSLILAEKIIKKEISVDPGWLGPVIKDALHRLADAEQITIQLNTSDFESLLDLECIVNDSQGKILWEPNESLEPGTCLINTEFGTIDASLDKRFTKLATGLQEVVYSE